MRLYENQQEGNVMKMNRKGMFMTGADGRLAVLPMVVLLVAFEATAHAGAVATLME